MKNDRDRRMAVARIIDGQASSETEAQKLGISKRQVERMVAATRKAIDDGARSAADGTSPKVTSPKATPPERSNPALDAAKKGAGLDGGAADKGPAAIDPRQAVADMAKYCVETVGMVKVAVFSTLVTMKYSPPLEMMSQDVQKVLGLGPVADAAIRANAPTLYPILVRLMSGPLQLAGGLIIDGLMTVFSLHSMAVGNGWKPKEKPAGQAGGSAHADIERARAAAPPKPPVTMPTVGEQATEETLKPGSPDPKPGTQFSAPTIPSGLVG